MPLPSFCLCCAILLVQSLSTIGRDQATLRCFTLRCRGGLHVRAVGQPQMPYAHQSGCHIRWLASLCLLQCFVDNLTAHCAYGTPKNAFAWFSTPIELYSARVVSRGANSNRPLLMITTGSAHGGDGGHSIFTDLFAYDRRLNEFKSVFSNVTGSNNNHKTRFIEQGPLRGDIIVDDPTSSAPFGYWISVYAWSGSGRYSLALRYRSATHYGDGNGLAVIDSEMPGI